ncbi:hypothetical protein [Lactococcus lactis]|uniref:hypothetical protein n=1 Tax=Lactococcus lactis TaxID=1358 RepID=UPI0024A9748D|nr:hypothetical protein [Lactococcus lactis]
MYKKIKQLLFLVTIIGIAIIGLMFLENHQNEIFGGERKVVSVEQSNINLNKDLNAISTKSNALIAKRIVATRKSGIQNTFYPIGIGKLPKYLPLQTDSKIIESSPNNTVYVIVKGNLTTQQLVKELNHLGNKATVFPTEHMFILITLLLSIPQGLMILLVIIFAFISLILAEYISKIRTIGVKRLAGKGKHNLAFKGVSSDLLFLMSITIVSMIGIAIFLNILGFFTLECFLIVTVPVVFWVLLISGINFLMSYFFYYTLQHQPINLSLKGKAPMRIILILVVLIQSLSVISVIYSVFGINQEGLKVNILKKGNDEWKKHSSTFQLSSLDDGNTNPSLEYLKNKKIFYKELMNDPQNFIIRTNFDSISPKKSEKRLLPDSYNTSNTLYVSNNFISTSGIKVSPEINEKISHLSPYENIVLIPKNSTLDYKQLSEAWEQKTNEESQTIAEMFHEDKSINVKTTSSTYSKGKQIFTYPIFNNGGQLISNESFSYYPIIIVGTPYSNAAMMGNWWNARVSNSNRTLKLIHKYHLEHSVGGLTNGLISILTKIKEIQTKQKMLIASTFIGMISSILLMILFNQIFFINTEKNFL